MCAKGAIPTRGREENRESERKKKYKDEESERYKVKEGKRANSIVRCISCGGDDEKGR